MLPTYNYINYIGKSSGTKNNGLNNMSLGSGVPRRGPGGACAPPDDPGHHSLVVTVLVNSYTELGHVSNLATSLYAIPNKFI